MTMITTTTNDDDDDAEAVSSKKIQGVSFDCRNMLAAALVLLVSRGLDLGQTMLRTRLSRCTEQSA
jgi:hypothetical protein